jgi:hypothetical protein
MSGLHGLRNGHLIGDRLLGQRLRAARAAGPAPLEKAEEKQLVDVGMLNPAD